MSQVGLQYQIGINSAPALAGLNKLRSSLSGLGGIAARALAPLAAGLSLAGLASGVKAALDLGGRLSDLSARTGESATSLAILEQAFKNSGLSAERVGPAINLLQRSLAGLNDMGQPTAEAFRRLGLSASSLRGQSATAQLQAISRAMQAVTDPAERSAIAMQLFGRSGGEMLALLADPRALSDAADTVGSQAEILGRNAALFDRVSDLLGSTGTKVQGFFVGVADRVAPVLLPLLESFNKLDLSGLGQQIGDIISFIAAAFSSGQLPTLIGATLTLAFQQAVNTLVAGLQAAAAALTTALAALTTPQFWAGLRDALLSAARSYESAIAAALSRMVSALAALLEKVGLKDQAAGLRSIAAGAQNRAESAATQAATLRDSASSSLGPIAAQVADAFTQAYQQAPPILDTEPMSQVLADSLASTLSAMDTARATAAAAVPQPPPPQPPAPTEQTAAATAPRPGTPSADRLAQIGGFVGAASRPDRAAEDTAKNTARTAKATETIASRLLNPQPAIATF